jgi:hypothetical protein
LIGSMIFHTLELVWGRMAVSERRLHIANWTARSVNSIYVEMKHGGQCWQLDQPPGARYVEGVGQDMEQEGHGTGANEPHTDTAWRGAFTGDA